MKMNNIIDETMIDFGMLQKDIAAWCKKNKVSLRQLSEEKLYHGSSYLSARISNKRIPQSVLMAVLDIIGEPLAKYKIEKVKAKKADDAKAEKSIQVEPVQDDGAWTCSLSVQEQFSIVSLAIYHNGKEIAVGHAKIKDNTDKEIAKSISYAAHICFKNVEQTEFVNRIGLDNPNNLEYGCYNGGVSFKDIAVKYAGERTDRGEMGRFIQRHYSNFPAFGQMAMRRYFAENNASPNVLKAFDIEFRKYSNNK